MATLATETWPGASGAALPAQWTTSIASGGTATQSGAGYATLNPGAFNSYLSTWAYLTGMTASVDTEVTGWFSASALVESYQAVSVRATAGTAAANPNMAYTTTGYTLLFYFTTGGAVELDIGKAGANLAGATATRTGFTVTNTQISYRLRVTGTTSTRVQARIWTGTEPGTWDIDVTDSTSPQTTAGKVRIDSTNSPGRFGPLTVTDAATAAGSLARTGSGTASFTGSPGGTLARTGTGTAAFTQTGATATGTLTRTGSGVLAFAVTAMTAAGVLARSGSGAVSLSALTLMLSGNVVRTGSGQVTFTAIFYLQMWTGDEWVPVTALLWDGTVWRSDVPITVLPTY